MGSNKIFWTASPPTLTFSPLHSLHRLLLVSGASSFSPHFHHRFIQFKWLNYLVLIGKSGGSYIYVVLPTTMCTCTFYGLARSMYVRGVAYVCGVANVFVFGGVPIFEMR